MLNKNILILVCVLSSIAGLVLIYLAADAGLVSPDEDIIAIAGTGGGCDTALLIQPNYTTKAFNLGIKEIVCKPKQVGVLHGPI